MSDWQPSDTAPERVPVLVTGKPYKNRGQLICIGILCDGEWSKADDMFGWHEWDADEPDFMDNLEGVTHWQPLPEPPGVLL